MKTVAGEDPGLSRGELIAPLELYSLELNPWSARVRGDFFRSETGSKSMRGQLVVKTYS